MKTDEQIEGLTKSGIKPKRPKKPAPADSATATNKLAIEGRKGVPVGHIFAESVIHPHVRNAATALNYGEHIFGKANAPSISDGLAIVLKATQASRSNNMDVATDVLTAQALSLDAMFTNMASRALENVGQYPEAADRYMRLALKAQSNCRATIEALSKISRGGEQVVRHIHVDNRGGQAMIAETIMTGGENGKSVGQPQTCAAIAGSPEMLGTHPLGQTLQRSGDGEWALQDARRSVARCAEGE